MPNIQDAVPNDQIAVLSVHKNSSAPAGMEIILLVPALFTFGVTDCFIHTFFSTFVLTKEKSQVFFREVGIPLQGLANYFTIIPFS